MTGSPIMQVDPISSMRYEVCLEAPTASAQRIDETPMTYLNKGQYYNMNLKDQRGSEGYIISTVIITFHDEGHRAGATDYWKFWLTHQEEGENAKAVEIGKESLLLLVNDQ
ncbi:hypothetical protein G6F56_012095 [Rhizopus delemar]|nr:hypothetical protein G6F56_012095 [Rhizopus delemar]